ncbi:hypothetical protein U1Q18_049283, partial [Sarracenia purpurea var. burkii]
MEIQGDGGLAMISSDLGDRRSSTPDGVSDEVSEGEDEAVEGRWGEGVEIPKSDSDTDDCSVEGDRSSQESPGEGSEGAILEDNEVAEYDYEAVLKPPLYQVDSNRDEIKGFGKVVAEGITEEGKMISTQGCYDPQLRVRELPRSSKNASRESLLGYVGEKESVEKGPVVFDQAQKGIVQGDAAVIKAVESNDN